MQGSFISKLGFQFQLFQVFKIEFFIEKNKFSKSKIVKF